MKNMLTYVCVLNLKISEFLFVTNIIIMHFSDSTFSIVSEVFLLFFVCFLFVCFFLNDGIKNNF